MSKKIVPMNSNVADILYKLALFFSWESCIL